MSQKVDILICGSGSAGVCAATWLARYGIRCKILEKRDGPMKIGQADGVQCRTVEVFESFGISEDLLRESFHVLEVAFWAPDGKRGIHRTRRTADTAPGLSHQPHVILNQARINGLMIEAMHKFNGQEIDYGYKVKRVRVDSENAADPDAHCVTVVAEKEGKEETFQAKYVLGCDGAHSLVRKSLGFNMIGDTSDTVWGVMDIFPRTNFPDIRRKSTLHSDAGALLIIPREGGSMVRFYIQLPAGSRPKDVKLEDLQKTARAIFRPYTMDIAETFWWSAYSIGQRLADHFHQNHRVFLTGDACHTHSPKAGQGMNVSLQDGYNIGWKLGMISKGQVSPSILQTYILERRKTAKDLIGFDREWAKKFSSKETTPEEFSEAFIKAGRYTAGLTARYGDSVFTNAEGSTQSLAKEVVVGMRFPSQQVVRLCDAKAMQLAKALPADGRWRIVIFAGEFQEERVAQNLYKLAKYLEPLARKYTPDGADIDSFIETLVVLSGERLKVEQERLPDYFWPVTGKWGMRDLHKVFVDDEHYNSGHGHAYERSGIDPAKGAIVIVRPDHYVSKVVPTDDHGGIGRFFHGFALER